MTHTPPLARNKRLLSHLSVALLGGLLFTGGWAVADGDAGTQSVLDSNLVIPYQGTLAVDDVAATGEREVRFDLYLAGSSASIWSETHTIRFHDGKFSVALGSISGLTDIVLDAQKVFMGLTILEDDGAGGTTEIALEGLQSIEPTPYAAWSANAPHMNVASTLSVAQGAVFSGDAADGTNGALQVSNGGKSLSIDGDELNSSSGGLSLQTISKETIKTGGNLEVAGTDLYFGTDTSNGLGDGGRALVQFSSDRLFLNFANDFFSGLFVESDLTLNGQWNLEYASWDGSFTGDGGAAIVNDNGSYDALMIVGNDSAGSDREVRMWDDVTISNNLEVPNGTHATATLSATTVTVASSFTRPAVSCPGSPLADLYTSITGSRLCVYTYTTGADNLYEGHAKQCWDKYGAELCTYSQMSIAVKLNQITLSSSTDDGVLGDRVDDDETIFVDGTDKDNFDGTNGGDTSRGRAFCCLMYNDQ